MADPRLSQNAARLSEDIGDVLTAIRRMIADDDALSTARDHIRAERTGLVQTGLIQTGLVQDDAGEFLARRYGGNAALARQMVEQAGRPTLNVVPTAPAATLVASQPILRADPAPATNVSPLRLDAERRVESSEAQKTSGWRAWLRPDARETVQQAEPAPVSATFDRAVPDAVDDADDFAEAFDWKARMRPELDMPAPVAMAEARPAEQRLSGWALPPEPVLVDHVARLAAEADAFDADLQAHGDDADNEQNIRDLLREMVQEELNGELGQKFSANLRAVIRREVATAIEAQLDRF